MLQAADSFYRDLARELDPHGTLQAGDYVPVVETKRPDGYIDLELHSPYGGTPLDFSLQPKQAIAWESDADEILFGGAAGGGKSFFLRILSIAYCVLVPGVQVYLFRRLSPDLQKNHMEGPTSYPELLAPWTSGGQAQILHSGAGVIKIGSSRIHLSHLQRESSLNKYYGPEMHVLLVDELTTFTSKMYKFLRGRVRLSGLDVPDNVVLPRIVAASNPGGISHNFVKSMFVDPAPPFEIHRVETSEGGMRRQFIPALLEDNPALHEVDPNYEDRLEGLGHADLVQALRYGSWDIEAGGMFDDLFDRDIHVVEPFEIPSSWYIDRSFDWGSTRPFSTGWWAESDGTEATMRDGSKRKWPKGTLFRIQEDYGWNGNENEGLKLVSSEIARRIIEREENFPWGKRVRPGPADPAIYTQTDGRSTADDMEQVGVRWVRGDASPGSRKTGAEALRTRLKAAIPPEDARPGWTPEDPAIYIFSHCRQWIRTVPRLPRDEKDPDKVDKNAEDHCFIGTTLVHTPEGKSKLQDLPENGTIWTDEGWKPYQRCRLTRRDTEVIAVRLNGVEETCTPDHLWLTLRGWVRADHLDDTDYVILDPWNRKSYPTPSKSSTGIDTTFAATTLAETPTQEDNTSIEQFGNKSSVPSQMGTTYTTRTTIAPTTESTTLNASPRISISQEGITRLLLASAETLIARLLLKRLRNGTLMRTARVGILSMLAKYMRSMSPSKRNVISAETHSRYPHFCTRISRDSVPPSVDLRSGAKAAKMMSLENVFGADRSSPSTNTKAPGIVVARVLDVRLAGRDDVYCLDVPGIHRFSLASGPIVHNCFDETKYRCLHKRMVTSASYLR